MLIFLVALSLGEFLVVGWGAVPNSTTGLERAEQWLMVSQVCFSIFRFFQLFLFFDWFKMVGFVWVFFDFSMLFPACFAVYRTRRWHTVAITNVATTVCWGYIFTQRCCGTTRMFLSKMIIDNEPTQPWLRVDAPLLTGRMSSLWPIAD